MKAHTIGFCLDVVGVLLSLELYGCIRMLTYHVPVKSVIITAVVGVDIAKLVSIVLVTVGLCSPEEWATRRCLILVEDHADTVLTPRNAYWSQHAM